MIDLNTVVSAVKQEDTVGYDVIPEGEIPSRSRAN